MFHRPSVVKDAMLGLAKFPDNQLTTSLANYPLGRIIRSSVDSLLKRGSKDTSADLCLNKALNCSSSVLGNLLVTDFTSIDHVLSLLTIQPTLGKHLAEAMVLYSDVRFDEMLLRIC